ncbi:MAG: hypothetical protein KDI82_07715 [Gammaproteobacteria bacterium]|nr:hypothetical protein [Gammaproteobacteria bacterium]
MKFPQRIVRLLILVALLPLAACRTNPFADELPESLTSQVRTFEDIVRWRALHKMYVFQKLADGETVEVQPGLENVRVTGYELIEPLNMVEPYRWRQAVAIDYVLTDRQVVRQIIDYQVWESEDEGKTWYRTTPVPQFR